VAARFAREGQLGIFALEHLRALGIQRGDFVDDGRWAPVRDFLVADRVLHGQVAGGRVNALGVHASALRRIG
jgi:hypothetical protein